MMKKKLKRAIYGVALFVTLTGLTACDQKSATKPVVKSGEYSVRSHDGLTIRYEVSGEGDTALVFVHCWACDRSFWDNQFNYFSKDFRVVRLDLIAHGASDRGRKTYDMTGFGADVAKVAEDLNLKKAVLIGHSMGGPVVVEAAKILGDRVVGVVGVDTFYTGFPYPNDDTVIKGFVKPFEEDFAKASEAMVRSMFPETTDSETIDHVVKVTQQADRKMAIEAMYDIFNWSRREVPASLQALGDKLRNINGEPMDKAAIPHASVTTVAGAGHYVQLDKPQEFNAALAKLLNSF